MSPTIRSNPIVIIAVIWGIVFLVPIYYAISYGMGSEGLAVIFAVFSIIVIGAGLVIQRVYQRPDRFLKQFGRADILNRFWFPLQDELTAVVNAGGRVTDTTSMWTTAPGISKRETPAAFYGGMEQYVSQRKLVSSLGTSELVTGDGRHQLMEEREKLLLMARDLLKEVNRAIEAIPGAGTAVRRTRRGRPTSAVQRPRPATTGIVAASMVGTRRSAPVSRSAQPQTVTSARTVGARSAPFLAASAPMRIAETLSKPSAPRPAPTPLWITDTPKAPEPDVAAPFRRVPGRSAQPSAPPADLSLDVASVCEELFNSDMMSYATNRQFEERYKDATVRWKGTVRRASTYSYDFEFGDGGGTKAELDIHEVKQQYGSRTVKAFVQLPLEAAADLSARIGEDVQFEGRLLNCEGSARRVYVADARVVD